jgi:hypothetical protein
VIPWLTAHHARYGPVERVSPSDISLTAESAWQDIYGFHSGRTAVPRFEKDKSWYGTYPNGVPSIVSAGEEL